MLNGPTQIKTSATSIIDAIDESARSYPTRGVTVVSASGSQERRSLKEIVEISIRVAAAIERTGLGHGDRILFAMPTGFDFVTAFLAAIRVGAIPVPIAPPRIDLEDSSDRAEFFVRICDRLQTRAALFDSRENEAAKPPEVGTLEFVLDIPTMLEKTPIDAVPNGTPGDIAYIQTSSGTTGTRRGVELTHAGILSNIDAIHHALGVRDDDVVVSWLPLYNVLGLLGMLVGALAHGQEVVLIDPVRFVNRPETWLETISAVGGTITAAPSHAFHYCVRRAQASNIETLDLSSLRVALVGGEQIRKVHLRAFHRRFEPCGLNSDIFAAVYGLSEATLCVSVSEPGDLHADSISRDDFEFDGTITPVDADAPVHERLSFVSVGRPLPGVDVMIVDERGIEIPDGRVGEVGVRGSLVMRGYFGEPTNRSPSSLTRIAGEWLLTGDLGYIRDEQLFVTGRKVDRFEGPDGRTIYPDEIEHIVNAVDGVRPGCVVAFDAGTDAWRIVIAAEIQPGAEAAAIERAIRSQLFKAFRLEPDEVLMLSPRSIPRSPNGKVRRHLTKMFYQDAILDRLDRQDEFDGLRRMWQRARQETQKLVTRLFPGARRT